MDALLYFLLVAACVVAGLLLATWGLLGFTAWADYAWCRPEGSTLGLGQVLRLGPLAWVAMLARLPFLGLAMASRALGLTREGVGTIRDEQGRAFALKDHESVD